MFRPPQANDSWAVVSLFCSKDGDDFSQPQTKEFRLTDEAQVQVNWSSELVSSVLGYPLSFIRGLEAQQPMATAGVNWPSFWFDASAHLWEWEVR